MDEEYVNVVAVVSEGRFRIVNEGTSWCVVSQVLLNAVVGEAQRGYCWSGNGVLWRELMVVIWTRAYSGY